ncbi:MAG: response regulator transcription factor [Deltaproteobacteria bacterium]|nr:response regulator transcription factor [Deltaproteobacteria bacterium]
MPEHDARSTRRCATRPGRSSVDLPSFGSGDGPPDVATRELVRFVMEILDAFSQPAWLVTRTGRVLHANTAASTLDWVLTSLGSAAPIAGPALKRVAVTSQGIEGWVVVLARPDDLRAPDHAAGLPPRLGATARLLAQGLSDKEVADRLGVSHATARTYVARVYRKLGVHRRAELFAPLGRSARAPPDEDDDEPSGIRRP